MWYKLKRILIYPDGVTEKQVYPWTITETYTLTWVPDWDVNKYISIAKSWHRVNKVIFKYSNTTSVTNSNNWVRISWNSNTVNRYWIWYTYTSWVWQVLVNWNINSQSLTNFYTASKWSWTSNVIFTIERWKTTLVSTWATTINTSWTQTTAEQNIVETVMNSATINAYASRNNWWTVSDITITVIYEPN